MPHSASSGLVGLAVIVLFSLVPSLTQRLGAQAPGEAVAQRCGNSPSAKRVSRTEVFLGLSKPDGSTVTDAEFQRFIDAEATPRFPDGFTVVMGNGQFKDSSGAIVREGARVLVVLYAFEDRLASASIEQIRAAYKAAFRQESVLRADGESCASF